MRKLIKSFVLGIVALCFAFSSEVLATDATVTIVNYDQRGASKWGNGYVSSPEGEVITCYHVVEGAVRISLYYNGHTYEGEVKAVAPDRDIAILQIIEVPLPTKFLKPLYKLPPNLTKRELIMEGYAAGLFDQRIQARATQDSFAPSETLNAQQNKRLFSKSGVKVLPLNLVVYRGMSGSPILTQDGFVIGILSGSLNEGGSIAWAIAIENALPKFTMPVRVSLSHFTWPKPQLMAAGWENLLGQSGLSTTLIDKIEAVTTAINAADSTLQQICTWETSFTQLCNKIVKTVDEHPGLANVPTLTDPRSADYEVSQSIDQMIEQLGPGRVKQLRQQLSQDYDRVGATFVEANKAAVDFAGTLPQTEKNKEITGEIKYHFNAGIMQEVLNDAIRKANPIQMSPEPPIPFHDNMTYSEIRKDVRAMLSVGPSIVNHFCSISPLELRRLSNITSIDFRLLLTADLFRTK